jgi:hypothetical protein
MTIATSPTPIPDLLGTAPVDLAVFDASAPPATLDEARGRAERIRAGLESYTRMRQDIADAYASRDWVALDYPSWFAYLEGEYGDELRRLTRDERRQAITDLRGQGMSTRQIAETTGVDQSTVVRSLATGDANASPATVTGTDGKTYPSTRPERSPFPGPSDAAIKPPVDPGATPPAAPVPPPDPDLAADVVRVLAGAGELGMTVPEIWCRTPGGTASVAVKAAVDALCEAGRVLVASTSKHGTRWMLTPEPGAVLSTAPSGSGPAEEAPTREGAAASAPEPKPTLRIVPDAAEVLAAEQRDARALLSRAVDLLAPVNRKPDWADVWVKQLGPYDDELSELCRRAAEAIATLDALIEGCGR